MWSVIGPSSEIYDWTTLVLFLRGKATSTPPKLYEVRDEKKKETGDDLRLLINKKDGGDKVSLTFISSST